MVGGVGFEGEGGGEGWKGVGKGVGWREYGGKEGGGDELVEWSVRGWEVWERGGFVFGK